MKISKDRLDKIVHTLKEKHLIELRPDEVLTELTQAVQKVRAGLAAKGYREFEKVSDEGILDFMREASKDFVEITYRQYLHKESGSVGACLDVYHNSGEPERSHHANSIDKDKLTTCGDWKKAVWKTLECYDQRLSFSKGANIMSEHWKRWEATADGLRKLLEYKGEVRYTETQTVYVIEPPCQLDESEDWE